MKPPLGQFTADCIRTCREKNKTRTSQDLLGLVLEARPQGGDAEFSMASLKRRAFNKHLLERISQHLAQERSLEKSSPHYQDLCDYGTINQRAV